MSQSQIATCPYCLLEVIYKGTSKRPRITCKRCKTRYYIPVPKTKKDEKEVLIEQKINNKTDLKIDQLSSDLLESMIINLLQEQVTENRVRIAVDFFTKMKLDQKEKIEELNMEAFLLVAERETEGSNTI